MLSKLSDIILLSLHYLQRRETGQTHALYLLTYRLEAQSKAQLDPFKPTDTMGLEGGNSAQDSTVRLRWAEFKRIVALSLKCKKVGSDHDFFGERRYIQT